MWKKRCQVTVFIIVGILIVVGFFILAYLLSTTSKDKLNADLEAVTLTKLQSKDLENYVTDCLEDALQSGSQMLLSQGFFFYPNQEGTILKKNISFLSATLNDQEINVTYLIYGKETTPYSTAPIYPCYSSATKLNEKLRGDYCYRNYYNKFVPDFQFGAPLEQGNRRLRPGLCSKDISAATQSYKCSCSGEKECAISVQVQLEQYINRRVAQCVDLKRFKEMLGIKVQLESPRVNISFGNDDTTATLQLPLKGDFQEGKQLVKFLEYRANIPVRIKTLYAILYGTDYASIKNDINVGSVELKQGFIDLDIDDITFDMVKDGSKILNSLGIQNITIRRIAQGDQGTIIQITDYRSMIFDKEVNLYFARQNRRPALDVIKMNSKPGDPIDINAYESDRIFLVPSAVDPDEDQLLFYYTGWKSDYDEKFDTSKGAPLRTELGNTSWMESVAFKYGEKCFDENATVIHRCAFVDMTKQDLGMHEMRVTVSDDSGLEDYQDLRIVVADNPNATFSVRHPYTDQFPAFQEGIGYVVSLEDPLFFNSSESLNTIKTQGLSLYFKWDDPSAEQTSMDMLGFFGFPYTTLDPYVVFPPFAPPANISVYNQFIDKTAEVQDVFRHSNLYPHLSDALDELSSVLSVFNISKRLGYFEPAGPDGYHRGIELKLLENGKVVDSATGDIFVADCFPYRADKAAYPFSLVPELVDGRKEVLNPYLANHSCCGYYNPNGDTTDPRNWRMLGQEATCYDLYDYGTLSEFTSLDSPKYAPEIPLTILQQDPNPSYVYERHLVGICSPTRGNICIPQSTITKFYLDPGFPPYVPPPPPAQDTCEHFQFSDDAPVFQLDSDSPLPASVDDPPTNANAPNEMGFITRTAKIKLPKDTNLDNIDFRITGQKMVTGVSATSYQLMFVMDTSNSMRTPWQNLCSVVDQVKQRFESLGMEVDYEIYAMLYNPKDIAHCNDYHSAGSFCEHSLSCGDIKIITDANIEQAKSAHYSGFNYAEGWGKENYCLGPYCSKMQGWLLGSHYLIDNVLSNAIYAGKQKIIIPIAEDHALDNEMSAAPILRNAAADHNIILNPIYPKYCNFNCNPPANPHTLEIFQELTRDQGSTTVVHTIDEMRVGIEQGMVQDIGALEPFVQIGSHAGARVTEPQLDADTDKFLKGSIWIGSLIPSFVNAFKDDVQSCTPDANNNCQIPLYIGAKEGKVFLEYCIQENNVMT